MSDSSRAIANDAETGQGMDLHLAMSEPEARVHDAEACALAFLWRQCLELRLKILVRVTRHRLGNTNMELKAHRLMPLWTEVQDALPQCGISVDDVLKDVGEYVRQFEELDPYSSALRYPTDKSNKIVLLQNAPTHINVKTLCEVMAWVINTLAALCNALTYGEDEDTVLPESVGS